MKIITRELTPELWPSLESLFGGNGACGGVEAYPSKPGGDGRSIASFSWTGTQSLFQKAGFEVVGNADGGKQRVRKSLANSSR